MRSSCGPDGRRPARPESQVAAAASGACASDLRHAFLPSLQLRLAYVSGREQLAVLQRRRRLSSPCVSFLRPSLSKVPLARFSARSRGGDEEFCSFFSSGILGERDSFLSLSPCHFPSDIMEAMISILLLIFRVIYSVSPLPPTLSSIPVKFGPPILVRWLVWPT